MDLKAYIKHIQKHYYIFKLNLNVLTANKNIEVLRKEGANR